MTITYSGHFQGMLVKLGMDLLHAPMVERGEWQSLDVSESGLHSTHELSNVIVQYPIPDSLIELQAQVHPSLPWAENHFLERVSGDPLNPPPSHVDWPWAKRNNGDHTTDGVFDHTYPERYWPRWAGETYADMAESNSVAWEPHQGIRFHYGDLADVVTLLRKAPLTRQAYLPVWFPEDTGGHVRLDGARVPCSLGYHFMVDKGQLNVNYFMRSCDVVRHFSNDVYLTARLCQWMARELNHIETKSSYPYGFKPGMLTMFVSSMHVMAGDVSALRAIVG